MAVFEMPGMSIRWDEVMKIGSNEVMEKES